MDSRTILLPNLYYFDDISDVDLEKIPGYAIVFIGQMPFNVVVPGRTISTGYRYVNEIPYIKSAAYLVYNHDILEQHDYSDRQISWDKLIKRRVITGKLRIDDNEVRAKIYDFIKKHQFPFTHCSLTLSENNTSITINYDEEEKDDLHPLIKKFIKQQQCSHLELLTLLHQLKACYGVPLHIKYFQKKKTERCEKSRSVRISIDDMLKTIHDQQGSVYMSFDTFNSKKNIIIDRFKNKEITKYKKQVLDDFEQFYRAHEFHPAFFPRAILVEKWAMQYYRDHGENPFLILTEHRRGGCLSLFNSLVIPDSILLFYRFLSGEKISPSLLKIMNGEENMQELTPAIEMHDRF